MSEARHTWLRASEAAEISGLCRWSLWRARLAGEIPKQALLKRGRTYRYARAWCEAQSARFTVSAPPPSALTYTYTINAIGA